MTHGFGRYSCGIAGAPSSPNTRSSEPSLGAATVQNLAPIASRCHISGMTDPHFPPRDRHPIAYARRKYAEERYPLSPELRPVREALANLDPKPEPPPAPKPYIPSTILQKKRRR